MEGVCCLIPEETEAFPNVDELSAVKSSDGCYKDADCPQIKGLHCGCMPVSGERGGDCYCKPKEQQWQHLAVSEKAFIVKSPPNIDELKETLASLQ